MFIELNDTTSWLQKVKQALSSDDIITFNSNSYFNFNFYVLFFSFKHHCWLWTFAMIILWSFLFHTQMTFWLYNIVSCWKGKDMTLDPTIVTRFALLFVSQICSITQPKRMNGREAYKHVFSFMIQVTTKWEIQNNL